MKTCEKIYISGPITGMPNLNREAFTEAKMALGKCAVNPFDLNDDQKTKKWSDYMRKDISALVQCDSILMLPGWQFSKGAGLELYIASILGFTIYYSLEEALNARAKNLINSITEK